VTREDVVTTVGVFAVDGKSSTREESDHSVDNQQRCYVSRLLRAEIVLVGLGQHRHEDRDGPVEVEKTQEEPDSPQEDEPVSVEDDHNDCGDE